MSGFLDRAQPSPITRVESQRQHLLTFRWGQPKDQNHRHFSWSSAITLLYLQLDKLIWRYNTKSALQTSHICIIILYKSALVLNDQQCGYVLMCKALLLYITITGACRSKRVHSHSSVHQNFTVLSLQLIMLQSQVCGPISYNTCTVSKFYSTWSYFIDHLENFHTFAGKKLDEDVN